MFAILHGNSEGLQEVIVSVQISKHSHAISLPCSAGLQEKKKAASVAMSRIETHSLLTSPDDIDRFD
jgi:hypothetical protein